MLRYNEAVQADVRKSMSPPHRQSVGQIPSSWGFTRQPSTTEGRAGVCRGWLAHFGNIFVQSGI